MDQQIAANTSLPPVVILALARHDGPYASTAWSLAKEFARQNKVLFIDNPFTLTDFFKKEKKEQIKKRYTPWLRPKVAYLKPDENQPNLWVVVPPLMLPVNWLPAGKLYRFFSGINRWLLKRRLDKCIQKAGIDRFVFLNSFNPFYGAEPPLQKKPLQYIYQTVDAMAESKYISKHGPRLEAEAMQQAGLCVATSKALCREAARWNKRAICIPNAANVTLFQQARDNVLPVPKELIGEERPVICYIGHIDHRLDYLVLNALAKRHPDKLFLLVGPVSGTECKSSGFENLPNVMFTGKKPQHELPAYLQYSKAAMIPFKCNALTASIYPLKLNEYLAAGKPVLSTPFSEDVSAFSDCIFLAREPETFADALEKALTADSEENRQKWQLRAGENTWEARASAFRALLPEEKKEEVNQKYKIDYEEAVK